MGQTRDGRRHDEEVTLRLVQDHAAELLRFARRFSLCADDAHDAYQRGIEILVRRMRTAPPDNPLNWVRTVIRNESAAVRMERERLVGKQEFDVDREEGRHLEDPSERVASHERLGHVAEALQRLKSQEVTALMLRAQGLSYKEICARTGWTYTKTNRAITEGRRALRDRLGAIESGAECDRWLPQLSLLADGEANAKQLAELRPHLRACPGCRATLRRFHDAPRQVAALVPVALVPVATGDPGTTMRHLEAMLHALVERATFAATRLQGALDTLPGAKVAAVAASTAALAGGGAAIQQATHTPAPAHTAAHVAPLGARPASGAGSGTLITTASWPTSRSTVAQGRHAHEHTASAAEFGTEDVTAVRAARSEFAGGSPEPSAAMATAPAVSPPLSSQDSEPVSGSGPAPQPARAQPTAEFAGP